MNLNQSLLNKRKFKSKNGIGITTFKPKQVMGPPCRPAPRRKSISTPSSATKWGRSLHSIPNTSVMNSGGSTTISTTETESRIIMALTEGRGDARCEVGMACIDLSLPTLILCQISDAQSYINTLTKINILNPTDIVIPATFLESTGNRLVDKIKKQFPQIKILSAPRKTFNKSNGMDRILKLCLPAINTICVGLQHKYYALAAASAVLTYLQYNLYIFYANESINVTYQESEGYAVIDVSTADRLELVASTKPTQATRYSSLFAVVNYCCTKTGARLLRSTILQPPCSPSIIEQTSNCVAELIKHPQTLSSVQAILQKISNIDQLLTITTMTLGTSDCCSVRQLNYLLLLNSLIDFIDPLKEVVENCQQPFFKDLKNTLGSDKFSVISNQIRTLIHPSAKYAKSVAGMTERCFAIQSGINGLLDLVRKIYSERLNDMTEYVKYLGNKYNLALSLGNNNAKGYHIILKLTNQQKRFFNKSELPPEFVQVYRLAGSCTMKTAELINYSTRLEDIMMEIVKISNVMIHKTMIELKQHIGFFYKLCEDIARLDMLQSLAEASRRGKYVRPKWGEFTELEQARHPILELLICERSVANPISICKDFNVQIVTGPNGSGKSIYIRQVMLLQIMAQVGCYVPAESAIFRPINRMFARVYLEDNMEYGASTFVLEMREIKYMMTLLSENSLFIVDELCRSTSADEGTALAMAITEKFCCTPVFLYVTTHYTELTALADMYYNVKTWQMETIANGDTPQDLTLNYKFRLIPGVTTLKHYGVYIVKKIWPQEILREVYRILSTLKSTALKRQTVGIDDRVKLKYKLESDLRKLQSRNKLTQAAVVQLLNDYQNELQKFGVFISLVQDDNPNIGDEVSGAEDVLNISLDDFETSSYRNLSNFLREDSDNINKLVPEVSIACSEREVIINAELDKSCNFGRNDSVSSVNEIISLTSCNKEALYSQLQGGQDDVEMQEQVSLPQVTDDVEKTVNNTSSPSAQTYWGVDEFNHDIELESMLEDLESCSEMFDEDDFEFSQASSYQTAQSNHPNQPENHQHIIPIVKIINGPDWISDSSCNSPPPNRDPDISHHSGSISYSPLCSPTPPNSSGQINKECGTTSSSSLHYVAKRDQEINEISINAATTSDTNLENISMNRAIDNVTIENLKSNSSTVEKSDETKHTGTTPSSLKESDKSKADSRKKRQKKKRVSENNDSATSSSVDERDRSKEDSRKKIILKKRKAIKSCNSTETATIAKAKRFIPPRKLTRKEIEEEFEEQNRKVYETDMAHEDFPKYLSRILTRPSVRQVQNSKHLAFVRRTEQGVEVIPAEPEPVKKPKNFPLKRILSTASNSVNVSIFSDKNARFFDEFVNSEERDVKRFNFNLGTAHPEQTGTFNFQPQSISDYAATGNVRFSFKSEFSQNCMLTPDGFYKQNKEDINNIVDKYLGDDGKANTSSIFETCSFNGDDLEL